MCVDDKANEMSAGPPTRVMYRPWVDPGLDLKVLPRKKLAPDLPVFVNCKKKF